MDCWSARIKLILYENDFGHVWFLRGVGNDQQFIHIFQTRIMDIQFRKLCSTVNLYTKLECYKEFKTVLNLEKYSNLSRFCDGRRIACFRISNQSLEVERRRFRNRVDRPLRICRNCHKGKVEDKIHFVLTCPAYEEIRKQYTKN